MDRFMKHAWHLGLIACLAGCAGSPVEAQRSRIEVDSNALRGEIALEAQRLEDAAAYFLRAAELTEDPTLAERATRIAYEGGLQDLGLVAVARWLEIATEDPRAQWFAGIFETRAGRLESATAHFVQFVGAAAGGGSAGGGIGLVVEALTAEPDPAAGVTVMRAVVEEYPGTAEGHYGLARLALRAGDFPLALENASAATELRPEWRDAQLLHARALLVSGRTDESLALIGRLAEETDDLEVDLQHAELLLSAGRMDEARERLTAILDDNPGLPEATRALAFLAMAQDDLEEATRLFDELRYDQRYRDEAFYYLGRIAETEEQPLRATRAYSRVTDGTHAVEAQLRTAGILMREMGDTDGAIRHLEQFGEANPRFRSEMLVARAQLLVQMQRPAEAMEVFEEALERNPDDAALHDAQAQLYVIMANEASGRGAHDEAEDLLDEGLERYPDNVSLRYSQALLLQEQGEMRRSVRVLEALVAEHPENPVLLNALGYLLTDQFDRHEEAREHIQKALAMDPDNAAIIDSMGWVLFKLGQYQSAFDYLDRAYRLEQDPEIAAHLVDVHWALGEREAALELLEAALERDPESRHLIDVDRRLRQ
jgi:tetratricopeptide (TPR) repeat protein